MNYGLEIINVKCKEDTQKMTKYLKKKRKVYKIIMQSQSLK